jgi:hypothetical protein
MIRSFIEMMLGEFGRQVLYFYEANALTINLLVLAYGLLMLMCWTSLVRIYRFIVITVARAIHENPDLDRKSTHKRVRETVEIPWQQAVDAAPFPLIARVGALVPRRKSVANLQRLFDEEEIVENAFLVLKGTHIRRIMPSYRRIVRKEVEEIQRRSSGKEE